jgi:ADP-heptose:LPS heptosyltransferase
MRQSPVHPSDIIVQRSGALGDVILITPVIRRLRRENPTATIAVVTGYPDVFRYNPHLLAAQSLNSDNALHINLDLAYERRPDLHIVQAYMLEAFGDTGKLLDLQQELFFTQRQPSWSAQHYVAVHAAVAGWGNRTLPRDTWRKVVFGLRRAGLWPVLVGSSRDTIPDCSVTTFHGTDIIAQAAFIDRCEAFVGSDSGILHVAGATDTPIVAVMTCARPETRLPWRYGRRNWNCTAIVPDIACVGCLQRRPPPVTDEFCERGDNKCVEIVDPNEIIAAVLALVDRRQ